MFPCTCHKDKFLFLWQYYGIESVFIGCLDFMIIRYHWVSFALLAICLASSGTLKKGHCPKILVIPKINK